MRSSVSSLVALGSLSCALSACSSEPPAPPTPGGEYSFATS